MLLAVIIIIAVTFYHTVNCQTDIATETNKTLDLMPSLKTGGAAAENYLSISRILTNLSIFNDDSNEYDTSMVTLMENITHSCLQQCTEEESGFLNEFGLECPVGDSRPECYRSRCFKGCELWWHALKEFEPCQEACSSTQFYPFDLPCISACETTQRQYWHFQRLHVERLLATKGATFFQPQLLHDNVTFNTLTLKWPITTLLPSVYLASRPFNIQYEYVLKASKSSSTSSLSPSSTPSTLTVNDTPDINSNEGQQQSKQHEAQKEGQRNEAIQYVNAVSDDNVATDDVIEAGEDVVKHTQQRQWWNLADYNCNENFECDITDGLMPYTSYKFRFQIPFGDNLNDILYSEATEVYTTPALGTPISKPIISQALSLDETHIAIFWQRGKFTNGPLTHYKLVLQQLVAQNHFDNEVKQLVKSDYTYFIYSNLTPSTTYNVRISMLNEEGEGPWSEANITTKAFPENIVKLEDFNTLVVAGEYSLVLKSLDPLVESRVLFKSKEILTDFDIHQYQKRLFVVNKKGEVVSLFMDDVSNYTDLHLPEEEAGFVPSKLAVDWLNQKLYVAGPTSSSNSWHLKRLNFNGSSLETIAGSVKPLKQLQIDPLNGWLLASTESFELCRLNLHSFDLAYFTTFFEMEWFSNQYQNFLLTAFNSKERAIYELSYDVRLSRQKVWHTPNNFQGDVLWYQSYQDWLFMSNGSFLLRQNLRTQVVDILGFKEIEWCWKVVPLMSSTLKTIIQPLPKPLQQPQHLQAVLSANKAQISWQPALRLDKLQSQVAWQNWEYELDILDVSSNNAFNIRSIKTTHFKVERLQANNLYKIKVRAVFAGMSRDGISLTTTSEWSEELITRTWPMGEHSFWWATTNGLWESDDLLKPAVKKALTGFDIKSFKQINNTLYYVHKSTLAMNCINLINPEVLCSFEANNVYDMDYDWRGAKLYWSDIKRDCIIRADLKGSKKEMLPLFGARLIQVDSAKGYIYYTTDGRLVRKKLNSVVASQELEYHHYNSNGESIQGFALDYSSQQIYWWLQLQEGGLRLFTSDLDFAKTKHLLHLADNFSILKDSFVYVPDIESFLWLKSESAEAILVNKDNFQQLTQLALPLKRRANYIHLKQDFVAGEDFSVIPDPVDPESVYITEGYWDDFNIKWSSPNLLENLTIFYKVLISSWPQNSHPILSFEVLQPIVRITEFKTAGYFVNVTIRPSTLWTSGSAITVQLKTPSAAPKQPKNLRVYVEQIMEPLQNQSNITALVRWDSPDNITAEKEVFYKVYCWLKEDLQSVKDIEDLGLKSHEVRFYNLLREESYMFQVQAFSLSRSKGGEKTSMLTHFINPEAQAIPKLLFTTAEYIAELDLDLNLTKQWVFTPSVVEHLTLISGEQRLLWVNENVELMSYQPGVAALKLARMRAEVLGLTVDWILRKVYWAEMSGEKENLVDIYELDLNLYEGKVMLANKIFSLTQGRFLKHLVVLPYSRCLLWLEYELGSINCTLQGRNITDFSVLKLRNHQFYTSMFEGSLLSEMESVNLVDLKGKLHSFELQRQLLTSFKMPLPESQLPAQLQRDSGFFYALLNNTLKAYNRRKHNLEFTHNFSEAKIIKAFNYQEYPRRECLLVAKPPENLTENALESLFVQEINEQYVILNLITRSPFENCKLPIPGLSYKILVKDEQDYEQVFNVPAGILNITQLKPFHNYTLEISASSYYQQKFSIAAMQYPLFIIRTQEGNPSQPSNFSAQAVSPSEISVGWREPAELNADSVNYQLYWQALNSSLTSHKLVNDFQMSLINLEASQEYMIWLEVYSKPSKLNVSQKVVIKTLPEPHALQLIEKEAYNLTLMWQPNADYDFVILECQPLGQDTDTSPFSIDLTGVTDNITITNLQPKTKYEFYLKIKFSSVERTYLWPESPSAYYVFETLADAPGRPGQPQIEHISGEIFKVFWEPAKNNGAPIIEYGLEALKSRYHKRIRRNVLMQQLINNTSTFSITTMAQMPWAEEITPLEDKWFSYCNTSELSCIVKELHTMRLLMFRVRARNEPHGWGPYSEDSERILEPFVSPQKRNSLVFAIIAPASIVSTCVIILFIIRKVQKRRVKAKQLLAKNRPSVWSNASAMQQQMASRNRTFSMASASTLYTGGPLSDADIALLPHINWNQITLLNFLGSGAFGEVYEGMLKYEGQEQTEKVAIKSLRKGASEFAELLQEAQLMSNFKHENIVSLIGVCCDTESISIIMEHMEGGDLLSYLRESRPNSTKPVASLQLLDLITMCIDVATGMAYLEDMHFVHRDLACRNCLVSSRIPSKRTVKIGDFGLARDIYKNDYYRKEGEALMPVRWMAPESLVDGIFTTQSDVWAFGVLCWEILTLGQQPYAARNNFEVLNYVKDGGRLEQPDNCTDKLFRLMTSCWQTDACERPSFRKCCNSLLAIKTDVRRVSLGYNLDDNDYAMYANQHGIILSSFLASTGLDKVPEEQELDQIKSDESHKHEIQQNSLNDHNEKKCTGAIGKTQTEKSPDHTAAKNDLKVRFNNTINTKNSTDIETWTDDEAHLIDAKLYRIKENPDYYVHEGVSRMEIPKEQLLIYLDIRIVVKQSNAMTALRRNCQQRAVTAYIKLPLLWCYLLQNLLYFLYFVNKN